MLPAFGRVSPVVDVSESEYDELSSYENDPNLPYEFGFQVYQDMKKYRVLYRVLSQDW